ncbi:translation initiation factor 2 (plastid) [Chondrus crispus]|uniref:Translation initiation factor IF-2, chloroplastic n=1 Tax=Chondrus crispus TaxID=2769 RepID=M5DDG6_CHOCR|nr:translation initiation factor 2 [Chondrus crispus]CCP38168.1 translation initiation factor 2 [Chondrus crispus]|eukprot:YP_007627421.1 translation initiation factor 2 (plastid) [Chondrus crispus]
MTNKILYHCKVFKVKRRFSNFIYCISLKKQDQESIFLLKNPMLVYTLEEIEKVEKKSLMLDTSVEIIDDQDIKLVSDFTPKFEKKHKNSSRSESNIEDKKNKTKIKKKARSQMILDNDEIFIDDHKLIPNSNKDSVNISLPKLSKQKKQKKKIKVKKNLLKDISDNINLNTECLQDAKINHNHLDKNIVKKEIIIDSPLTIEQLAYKLNVPEAAIITWLFLQGVSVTINQVVDISIASQVASHYDFTILDSSIHTKENHKNKIDIINGQKRAPIVVIFGHVDHGKTTLLDSIRKTNTVSHEVGGITQSIIGYEVEHQYFATKEQLVFLDTPGHQAFSSMRLRGAQVSDVAILLVAADDGLKKQTIEAIDYIMNNQIPYIVAINKTDKLDLNLSIVREQLANYNIVDQNMYGNSNIIEISALTGKNIDLLLNQICELSNKLSLKSDNNSLAQGTILESYLDKQMGAVANIVIKNGALKVGHTIVSGNTYGRIKAIMDHTGSKINYAIASSVVNIYGFPSIPEAGLHFQVIKSEKNSKYLINKYIHKHTESNINKSLNKRITLDSCSNKSRLKQVNLIIKADTQGSIEAIINSLAQIPQDKVQLNILSATSGCICHKDIDLATTSKSAIIGFNTNIETTISKLAKKLDLNIQKFEVIYDLLEYLQDYMLNLMDIEYDKVEIGEAIIKTVFHVNKGMVAGCIVNRGKLKRNAHIVIYRDKELLYKGKLDSLKHMKDNIDEVLEGNECGVMCNNYNDFIKFDIIKAYELIKVQKVL